MSICPAACGFSSLYLLPGAAVLGRRGQSVGGPGQGSTAASAATVRQWPCKSTLQLAQFLWFVWLEAIEIHRAQSGGSGKSLPGCLALGFIRQQPATHAQWECQRDNGAPGRGAASRSGVAGSAKEVSRWSLVLVHILAALESEGVSRTDLGAARWGGGK
jgi:hypothetical protein